jgi:transglutaminase-like putative cysteine protease
VEAWTITRDGTRHVVPADRILTQSNARSESESMFSDRQALIVIFPKVGVGSQLHVRTLRTRAQPVFPGHVSRLLWWSPHMPHEEVAVDVLLDAGVDLKMATRDASGQLRGGRVASQPGDPAGSSRYRYTYAHPGAAPKFPDQVDTMHYAPTLVLGTFGSWAEVARAYRARAKPKVTPDIRATALEIVQGARSLAQRAERLHHWMARNIRYVSVTVGDGGLIPHDAQRVLDNGYGDCKDKAMLLEALLAAVGIEAGPVLVNTEANYELPPQPTPFAFNHVIVHVPALNLYLDPTHSYTRAGTLPPYLMGKPVLLVREGRVARIPHMNPAIDHSRSQLTAGMIASGAILGHARAQMRGALEVNSRTLVARALEDDGESTFVERLLARQFEPGSGSIHASPDELEHEWVIETTFELEPQLNLPGPGALRIPLALAPGRILALTRRHGYANRQQPFVCESARHEEVVTLDFPEGTTIAALPPAVDFQKAGITYRSRYELKGRTLTATRTYVAKWPGPICEPKDDLVWLEFRPVLVKDLRGQVVVR